MAKKIHILPIFANLAKNVLPFAIFWLKKYFHE